MPGRITWQDIEEISLQLLERYPDVDPYSVRFTDLHKWITTLPGFDDDVTRNVEAVLEQIVVAWDDEKKDAAG